MIECNMCLKSDIIHRRILEVAMKAVRKKELKKNDLKTSTQKLKL
jgi:hypothetical protein